MIKTILIAALGLGALAAQPLQIGGDIPKPLSLTTQDLAKMPRTSVAWSEHGSEVNYEGVLLHEILKLAGAPLDKQLAGKALASYILAEAEDGYQVVFTLPELDPGFTGNRILLADTANGQPLGAKQGPFRIVAAQDKKGARSIRMLTKLTVVRLRK